MSCVDISLIPLPPDPIAGLYTQSTRDQNPKPKLTQTHGEEEQNIERENLRRLIWESLAARDDTALPCCLSQHEHLEMC